MVKPERFIFGYRRVTLPETANEKTISRILALSVTVEFVTPSDIIISERDYIANKNFFDRIPGVKIAEKQGLIGIIKRIKYKSAIISATIFSLILLFLLSNSIWDVRIEGNDNLSVSEVKSELTNAGLSIGDLWFFKDRSAIEISLLENSERISWVNINRRGSVAYVTVSENEYQHEPPESDIIYSNIISTCDCVIDEITVTKGTRLVKVGDAVKRGDVLILGITENENGTSLCRAEGAVVGRMSSSLVVDVAREYEKKTPEKEKIQSVTVDILNFSKVIFKIYGNSPSECDIIEEKNSFSLFGKCKLPFAIRTTFELTYRSVPALYSDGEIVSVAKRRMESLIAARLSGSDLLHISTSGSFTDKGYRMLTQIEYRSPVSRELSYYSE